MKKVIILNAPPASGKDTLADLMVERNPNAAKLQFKDELYNLTAKFYDVPLSTFKDLATNRDTKDKPLMITDGLTPREALIHVSETVIKLKHGKDFFGKTLLKSIDELSDDIDTVIISDGGFIEEVIPLTQRKDINLYVVRMFRNGFNFEEDSRKYLPAELMKYCRVFDMTLYDDAVEEAYAHLRHITGVKL